MEIELDWIKILNFKGIKNFEVEFGGNAVIAAENGVGKTSVFDAFLWLLFGKDSTGRKDFEVIPLDKDNQPIKGLVTTVEACLRIDSVAHVFKKELHENVVKGQLRGYTTACSIDDVPKKVGEYADYITELIPEDKFKLLTDLDYFNGKMHWKEQRNTLSDVAADYEAPEGFEKLHEALNGRTIDDYKKVLKGQKDGYAKERDEINPRMDEIQKSLDGYADEDLPDTKTLEAQRVTVTQEISKLRVDRSNLMGAEAKRQNTIEAINWLKNRKAERESELKNDTSGIKTLLDEKQELEIKLAEKQQELNNTKHLIEQEVNNQANVEAKMNKCICLRTELSEEYQQVKQEPANGTCYACGQALPEAKLAELETQRQAKLKDIEKQGFEQKEKVDEYKAKLDQINQNILTSQKILGQATAELAELEKGKQKRFAEIDEAIKNNPTTPPEKDERWLDIYESIKKFESELGEPVGKQLEDIETMRISKENALERINSLLNNHDNIVKAAQRIKELESREQELAQLIADVEAQLAMIDEYNMSESKAIEQAVNGLFKHVEFKLFDYLLNGEIKECCEATLNGVPYKDMSTGQQIFVGLDIVNVLSSNYGISAPLFIDHAESITLPLETELQTIKLFAKEGVSQLTVEKEKELVDV